nr:hypothetical protein [Klebsiella pneumoniae subsp. pneumoniae]
MLIEMSSKEMWRYVESDLLMEGANKQVISSQADSLIKISRIWADFFRKHIESAYLGYFFHHFWRYFRFY